MILYPYQHLFDGEMAKLTLFAELFQLYALGIHKNGRAEPICGM